MPSLERLQFSFITQGTRLEPPFLCRSPALGVKCAHGGRNSKPRKNVAEAAAHTLSRRASLACILVAAQSQRALAQSNEDTGELAVSVIYDAKADGRSPRQNVVVEGLAAGRGGGKGLLLAAAAAAPAYFGFRFLADKASKKTGEGPDRSNRGTEPPPASQTSVMEPSLTSSSSNSSASMALARLGAVERERNVPAIMQQPGIQADQESLDQFSRETPAGVPMPVLDHEDMLQQSLLTLEAIKQGMARNEALMEELKAHFKENGEQVRLLTGRIDWQQKALQEAAPSSSSEPLDSTGQAMSQILKAGTPEQLQDFLDEDQKRLRVSGGSLNPERPKMLPPSERRSASVRSPSPPRRRA